MATDRPRAIVIGGGVESLAAAAGLARRGWQVQLFERRATLGGRHDEVTLGGGCTAPLLFDDVAAPLPQVVADLDLQRSGLAISTGRGLLAALAPDGRATTVDNTGAASRDEGAVRTFVGRLARLATAVEPVVHRAPPRLDTRSSADLWTAVLAARQYLRLTRDEIFTLLRWPPMPVADIVEESFDDPVVAALVATRGLGASFGGPKSAGTGAVMLMRAAADGGAFGPTSCVDGGGASLVRALAASAQRAGVDVRTGTVVEAIAVEGARARGVVVDGRVTAADAVVSGLDPKTTLLDLLDPSAVEPRLAWRVGNVRARGVTARVFLVLERLPRVDGLAAWPDRLHLAADVLALERAFDAVKYDGWSAAPWVEVSARPSGGGAVLACTVHFVPSAPRGTDWASQRDALLAAVIKAIDDRVPGVAGAVAAAEVRTPDAISRDLGLSGGHPYHAELALDQLWAARPTLGMGGYRTPVASLYLCGPSTHPGLGRPGTSGWLASREMLRDGARRSS